MKPGISMYFCLILLFILISPAWGSTEPVGVKYTISGYVKDANNGEMLVGAVVYIEELNTGTSSNAYGFYSMSLPAGQYNITYRYIGYETLKKTIELNSKRQLN
jgi:hypothetical protein